MKRPAKKSLIQKHQQHDSDTGSPRVQIVILTARILEVTKHLGEHRKDIHSRRGLLKMVETRRKLFRYIEKHQPKEFESVKALVEKMKEEFEKANPAKKAATKKKPARVRKEGKAVEKKALEKESSAKKKKEEDSAEEN